MSDEELDNIFRSAAEDSSMEYDVAGWKDMYIKLDQADRSVWYRHTSLLLVLCGMLLIGTSTWYYISGNGDRTDIGNANQTNNSPMQSDSERKKSNDPRVEKINPDGNSDTPLKTGEGLTRLDPDTDSKLSSQPEPLDDRIIHSGITTSSNRPTANNEDPLNSSSNTRTAGIELMNPVPSSIDSIGLIRNSKRIVVADSSAGTIIRKRNNHAGWFSLRLSVAPDFSSTGMFNQSKPGFGFGVTAGYNFDTHWSINTGVMLVRKVYSSTNISEPYSTQGGYSYPIDQLDGNCKMLDLPLNVYYSFQPHKSLSFKAGLGFSSYIMLREDYTYFLDKPYGNDTYTQRIENENNEWFKMLNVSVMMQKRIRNNLFLEVEPFVKLPLAGIGEGGISLYSFGSFVSLRYDFK